MTPHAQTLSELCVVGQRNTITLPKLIRKVLGIEVGDTVRFEVSGGQVVVQRMKLIPANSELAMITDRRVRQIAKGESVDIEELRQSTLK